MSGSLIYICSRTPRVEEKVYLDRAEVDLGDVRQFEPVRCSVNLVNGTLHPITIVSTNSSCACSVADVGKKVLGPSEQTPVDVTFKPGSTQGISENNTEFVCNYKERLLSLQLKVRANTLPNFKVDRKLIEFDVNNLTVDFTIASGVLNSERIVEVSSTTDLVKVSKSGPGGRYSATLSKVAKPGDLDRHAVVVSTNEPPSCWLRIPLYFKGDASRMR